MEFSIHSVIFVLAVINGLIFSIVCFLNGKDNANNYYLATLLLLLTLIFFDEFGRWTPDFFRSYPQFTIVFSFAWFLFIPTVYVWIRYQTYGTRLKWSDIMHAIPLVIFNLKLNRFTIGYEQRQDILISHFAVPEGHFGKLIFSAQIVIYLYLLFKTLSEKYRYNGLKLFHNLSIWLKSVFLLFLLYLMAIWTVIIAYEVYEVYLIELDIWKTNFFLVFIYGWLFYALIEPGKLKIPVKSFRIWKENYRFDHVSSELSEIIEEIRKKELYLNNGLGVPELATELGISGRRLSDLVNKELNISIPILINILRIEVMEHSIGQLDFKRLSLEGVAKSVGFKSKSSFYSFFKEFTGETPSKYFRKAPTDRK